MTLNLSKATKLREVIFQLDYPRMTLKHRDLRNIWIYMHYDLFLPRVDENFGQAGEDIYWQWSELDNQLVQFWESRSI